ncbi:MAG: hypothetical protein EBX40_08800, partial [Gammaproteobacteria bacterium]|nr:hypothetical protein [Gammaproteobacteria bacterium]
MANNVDVFKGKFDRRYLLKVETSDNTFVEITDPLTLDFNVVRNNLSSSNTASFTLMNLGPILRTQIFKDQYDMATFRAVQLYAGYVDEQNKNIPLVFNGA